MALVACTYFKVRHLSSAKCKMWVKYGDVILICWYKFAVCAFCLPFSDAFSFLSFFPITLAAASSFQASSKRLVIVPCDTSCIYS